MTEFHKDNGWDSLVDIGGGTVTAVLTTDIITLAIYHPWPGDITLVLSTQKDNIMTQVWIQLSVQISLLAVTVDLIADIITLLHDIQLHVIIVKDIDCRAIKYWTWLIICMCSHSHFMLLDLFQDGGDCGVTLCVASTLYTIIIVNSDQQSSEKLTCGCLLVVQDVR